MTICLETASRSSYSSIVFPAMGTGYLGYPKDQVAAMMYKTVIEYAQKSETTIKEVIFVCYSGDLETIKVSMPFNPIVLEKFYKRLYQ